MGDAVVVVEVADEGQGRACVIIAQRGEYEEYINALRTMFSGKRRAVVLSTEPSTSQNQDKLFESLEEFYSRKNLRQSSFVAFGGVTSIMQRFALQGIHRCRTLCFVDGVTRPKPSLKERVLEVMERNLPLGLPFRASSQKFFATPLLQRIRCPTLVVVTPSASAYVLSECQLLLQRLPSCWGEVIRTPSETTSFASRLLSFQDVPAKRPQKNTRAGRAPSHSPTASPE